MLAPHHSIWKNTDFHYWSIAFFQFFIPDIMLKVVRSTLLLSNEWIYLLFQPNPTYNYEYQVADDEVQTYITHREGREDNVVTGQYSYVDPFGALITVTYIADSNGYREERKSEANFVQVRAQPARAIQEPAPVSQVVLPAPVRRVPVPKPAPKPAPKPIVRKVVKAKPASDDSDLVARIIAQLTPFIRNTVSTSLESSA